MTPREPASRAALIEALVQLLLADLQRYPDPDDETPAGILLDMHNLDQSVARAKASALKGRSA